MLNSLSLKTRSTKISILVMSVLVAFPLLPYEFTGKGNIAPTGIVSADVSTYIPKDIALNPGNCDLSCVSRGILPSIRSPASSNGEEIRYDR